MEWDKCESSEQSKSQPINESREGAAHTEMRETNYEPMDHDASERVRSECESESESVSHPINVDINSSDSDKKAEISVVSHGKQEECHQDHREGPTVSI